MSVSTWSLQTHSDFSDLPDIQIVTNKYGYRFCYVTYQASHVYTANNRHCEHTHVLNKPHEERLFLLKKKKKVYCGISSLGRTGTIVLEKSICLDLGVMYHLPRTLILAMFTRNANLVPF